MSATGRKSKRQDNDFYGTPDWLTRALLNVIEPALKQKEPDVSKWNILEPASGEGAIVKTLKDKWPEAHIDDSDIVSYSGKPSVDFLQMPSAPQKYNLVVTNPPYSLATEFVQKAMYFTDISVGGTGMIAMLMRINWLASKRRATFLRKLTPTVMVTPARPSFTADGKTDSVDYAWMVWGFAHPCVVILETERAPKTRRAIAPITTRTPANLPDNTVLTNLIQERKKLAMFE
jgi:hypothetical protein